MINMATRPDKLPFFRFIRVAALVLGIPAVVLTVAALLQNRQPEISDRNRKAYDYVYDLGTAKSLNNDKYPPYERGDQFKSKLEEVIVFIGVKWATNPQHTKAIFKIFFQDQQILEKSIEIQNGYNHMVIEPSNVLQRGLYLVRVSTSENQELAQIYFEVVP